MSAGTPERDTRPDVPAAAPEADVAPGPASGDQPSVVLELVVLSNRGSVRSANEDAVGVAGWVLATHEGQPLTLRLAPPQDGVVVAVADGMGGHRGGAEASRAALTVLGAEGGDLPRAVAAAAEALRTRAAAEPSLEGMGSTVVGMRVHADGAAAFFNIGDSRAYRVVEGYLGQISVDDRPPVITAATRGVVTQHLGGPRVLALDPHLHQVRLVPGDRVLLCSDGLTDLVDDDAIAAHLRAPAVEAATALVDAALQAGGDDNVTVVVLDVRGGDVGGGAE